MRVARRRPCPWGSGMLLEGCGGMRDAASGAPGRGSSAHFGAGGEGKQTLFRSEVCLSLYLDAAPLLNLVSPH